MATLDYDRLLAKRLLGWKPDLTGTLMFVRRDDRVLLIHKKRGHGAGKINGPGGKVDPGETVLEAAVRETREETGIVVLDAVEKGRFSFLDLTALQWAGHVFLAHRFEGEPVATEEADPLWYPVDALPFERMWEDDRYWLPRLLAGERLCGEFLFDDGRLLAHRLRPWEAD
jgi:8-oxo-dGTP diphosphatase